MAIESTYSNGSGRPRGRRATILEVLPGGYCKVRHQNGKTTFLSKGSRNIQWQPVQEVVPKQLPLSAAVTEDDVRRIVREELRAMFAPKGDTL